MEGLSTRVLIEVFLAIRSILVSACDFREIVFKFEKVRVYVQGHLLEVQMEKRADAGACPFRRELKQSGSIEPGSSPTVLWLWKGNMLQYLRVHRFHLAVSCVSPASYTCT